MLDALRRRPGYVALALALLAACRPAPPRVGGDPGAETAGRPGPVPLRLGVIGDQTLAGDLDGAYAALARGVAELTRYHHEVAPLDAVVHTGDLVESAEPVGDMIARFAEATSILDRLPVPWYPAAGDHDVNPPVYLPGSPDVSRRQLYRRLVADRIPAADDALHYAVEVGSHRLIVLDSQQVAHADPRWGSVFLARLDDRQLGWLSAELAAGDPASPIVVVLHQPHWLTWSGWRRVHEVLRRHPVAVVVAGHLHHPQDDGLLDGIRYLAVGATGGLTRTGSRGVGDVDHVTVVEVGERQGEESVRVVLLPLDGEPLALPSRREMERAQALDMMLGRLFEIGRHPLYLDAGELVADCGGRAPARLVLHGLGNPIDREVTLTIGPPPWIELLEAAFTAGFCVGSETDRPAVAGTACRLAAPSPNVLFAHPSGVELADDPPLWQAGLAFAPTAGGGDLVDALTFRVVVSWVGDETGDSPAPTTGGSLWLERPLQLDVHDCP